MNCRKARSLLSAFCEEELSHSVREKLVQHLDACPSCRKESVAADQISETVKHLPRQELSDDFNMKLFERIHNAPRVGQAESIRMPKAAPSAFFYRLKLAVPVISVAGMLVLALTLVTGTAEITSGDHPEVASAAGAAPRVEQTRAVSQGFHNTGLRGLRLEQAMLESLTVAVSARNGSILERLGRQQKQDFGMFNSRSYVRNVSQQTDNMRHYVLPNVPSTRRLAKNAAY
jgi:hypothetical protein